MPAQPPAHRSTGRTLAPYAALAAIAVLAGCAQQRTEGYYNPPGESTITDAQYQGQAAGYRTVVHAPSQLQIELKPRQPNPQQQQQNPANGPVAEDGQAIPQGEGSGGGGAAVAAGTPRSANAELIPQAQTFQGTLPCFATALNCEAQRVTLTLAPNGRWRARLTYLENTPGKTAPSYEQGCWDATQERPPRVLLLDGAGNMRADLSMPLYNTLRVRSVNGHTPNLAYTLTRQPDLDPIAELKQAETQCPG
ncbi:copper resistance protein NlpE N-terminal domain-containing protein [Bordetella genomosp. 5]|uniref:copper resistance protein NlpE N-terminal domain-containing protein n=1 Tax=Bordetella genomosp. 5 TaxID=1395608 RepID=UPI00114032C8|nr:copper resistance protein NlpE N-terminal domain-containing protein [Bordetella genomosp. 5]